MDIYSIEPHLDRARSFIEDAARHPMLYAALELRFCFEAIAYRHMDLYGDQLPSELVSKWKADQIIKTLAEFDPQSDQTSELSISVTSPKLPEDASEEDRKSEYQGLKYLDLGASKRISWRVFRKHYNTLGSYLHLDREENNVYPTQEKLRNILSALEDANDSKIIYAVKDVHTAICQCEQVLVLGPAERGGKPFSCPNKMCNRIYATQPDNAGSLIYPVETVLILCECGAQVPFHTERILKPAECPNCRSMVRARVAATGQVMSPSLP